MSQSHHVFGPAGIYTSVGQSPGNVSLLGMTVDGANVEVIRYVDPIHDDRAGPNVSTDEQRMGSEARITTDLVWYDEPSRAAIFAMADNGTTSNEGTQGYAGVLFGLGGFYYTFVIQAPGGSSPTSESLWNFTYCRLLDAQQVKFGTVKNVWRTMWKSVNYLGTATSLNASVLYKHTFP